MKKRDWIIVGALVALALAAQLYLFFTSAPAGAALVQVAGKSLAELPLGAERRFEGQGAEGPFEVEVGGGEARMVRSTCPDQLCVKQGSIHRAGQSITCLPNRVTITLTGEDERALDAVVY